MPEFSRNIKPGNRVTIVNLEGAGEVIAHYNPKEIQIDKTVPWQKHKDSKADEPLLEFTGAEGRTLTMELLFDSFEDGRSIDDDLKALTKMAKMKQQDGPEDQRRPPLLAVKKAPVGDPFKCVIESLSIKVTMFDENTLPVRATVNIKLKEAERLTVAGGGGGGGAGGTGGTGGTA